MKSGKTRKIYHIDNFWLDRTPCLFTEVNRSVPTTQPRGLPYRQYHEGTGDCVAYEEVTRISDRMFFAGYPGQFENAKIFCLFWSNAINPVSIDRKNVGNLYEIKLGTIFKVEADEKMVFKRKKNRQKLSGSAHTKSAHGSEKATFVTSSACFCVYWG